VGLAITAGAEGDVAKSAGDALYTVLVQTLVVVVAPRLKPAMAAGIAVGISWTVEFSQLSGVPSELSERSVLASLVLGSRASVSREGRLRSEPVIAESGRSGAPLSSRS
jgi:hypothetical protein